jgi:hypothetical protein
LVAGKFALSVVMTDHNSEVKSLIESNIDLNEKSKTSFSIYGDRIVMQCKNFGMGQR